MTAPQLRAAFWSAMEACGEDPSVHAMDMPYANDPTVDGHLPDQLWDHMAKAMPPPRVTVSMMALTSRGLADAADGECWAHPEVFTFPGGEHHLRNIPEIDGPVTWIANVRGADPNDVVKAALLADVARDRGDKFVLMLPYLPAARADRGTPFGARVYAQFINAVGSDFVVGIDPHSAVITEHVTRLRLVSPVPLIERAVRDSRLRYDAVIAPDHGALQRATDAATALGIDLYLAEKTRDFDTGAITGIRMTVPLPPAGRFLVVDDICDGGGTFRGLAEATGIDRERLGLWVTHGIFSGRADDLRKDYAHILTTDSHPGHNRVGVATTIVPTLVHMLNHIIQTIPAVTPSKGPR